MILYEFTISDGSNFSIPEIIDHAERAAKEEAEFMFQCSQGTEEWIIESVELDGLPVAKEDYIVYKFVVKGKIRTKPYAN